ncbi:hypothetical protein M885DRAFT_510603 [Pelagophyceae sp. CCMP2097]|nr:hypothetical protein M885DRAFT_510603 [Pelagophyceae sp. CCMP2097]
MVRSLHLRPGRKRHRDQIQDLCPFPAHDEDVLSIDGHGCEVNTCPASSSVPAPGNPAQPVVQLRVRVVVRRGTVVRDARALCLGRRFTIRDSSLKLRDARALRLDCGFELRDSRDSGFELRDARALRLGRRVVRLAPLVLRAARVVVSALAEELRLELRDSRALRLGGLALRLGGLVVRAQRGAALVDGGHLRVLAEEEVIHELLLFLGVLRRVGQLLLHRDEAHVPLRELLQPRVAAAAQ